MTSSAATRAVRGGGRVGGTGFARPVKQERPWPPPGLLDDTGAFLAAIQNKLPSNAPKPIPKPTSTATTAPLAVNTAVTTPATAVKSPVSNTTLKSSAITIGGVSIALDAPIKKVPVEEIRPTTLSSSDFTDGKPSPVTLSSPSVASVQEAASSPNLLGLGISGAGLENAVQEPLIGGRTPADIVKIEKTILQKFVDDGDSEGLIGFLKPLLDVQSVRAAPKATKASPGLASSIWATDDAKETEPVAVTKMAEIKIIEEVVKPNKAIVNPFSPREPVEAAAGVLPAPSKLEKIEPKKAGAKKPSPGLGDSIWANPAPRAPIPRPGPLRDIPTNGSLPVVTKASNPDQPIFGDNKNLCKSQEAAVRKIGSITGPPRDPTAIKRTEPGPGYFQMIVDKAENMKIKPAPTTVRKENKPSFTYKGAMGKVQGLGLSFTTARETSPLVNYDSDESEL